MFVPCSLCCTRTAEDYETALQRIRTAEASLGAVSSAASRPGGGVQGGLGSCDWAPVLRLPFGGLPRMNTVVEVVALHTRPAVLSHARHEA